MGQKNNIRRTSWSDEDLLRLCDPSHHRIWYDGYDYWWQQNITGEWQAQCREFESYAKAYSFLVYNLASWQKEYEYRDRKKKKKELRKIREYKKKIKKIEYVLSSNLSNKSKVLELIPLMDEKDISTLLNITTRTIKRYLTSNSN